ncbi:MAG: tRNA 2-selenouridine(34) synthase MnmH [Bacteroidetes bacterium]|nr:tRNA 2-selenouridine(34) synthase MnmH [Bacteroidota bacterium]
MIGKDSNLKEIFDWVTANDVGDSLSVKDILNDHQPEKITIDELLSCLRVYPEKILLIDARSENEFRESSIPHSKNFPVLTNEERHNVGFIYKKYSQSAAVRLALNYAGPKSEDLSKFLSDNNAPEKKIIVYCWRGGGRSAYLSKMISDLGFNTATLISGFKSFRNAVNIFFSSEPFEYGLLEISGLTGCGKTDLIKSVQNKLPVIDLENAAKHFSSLLGRIPYEIRGIPEVSGQSEFENNIFSGIKLNGSEISVFDYPLLPFLIESESKRVGKFDVPEKLYAKMEISPSVKITGSLEKRVERIVKDYFSDKEKGTGLMLELFRNKGNFFKQQLSNKIFDELIELLNQGKVFEFTEIMIRDYYDKRYREKKKNPGLIINSDDMIKASEELTGYYMEKYQNKS